MKAGTNTTPPASGTVCAIACTSALPLIARRPSRSHCTTAPAMNTLPSSANSGVAPPSAPPLGASWAAEVVISPFAEVWNTVPVCISMKQPVP